MFKIFRDWKEELQRLQHDVSKSEKVNVINVNRLDVLSGFARAAARPTFCPSRRLDVCFVDADEASEGAVDSGGPSREFFRLLIRQFLDSPIFEGGDEKHMSLSTVGKIKFVEKTTAIKLITLLLCFN